MARGLSLDDFAAVLKAKSLRVTLWFMDDMTRFNIFVFIVASGPAEHLLQLIQRLDARGAVLRDICFVAANPFSEALRTYTAMLLCPMASGVQPVWSAGGLRSSQGSSC